MNRLFIKLYLDEDVDVLVADLLRDRFKRVQHRFAVMAIIAR